MAPLPEDVPDEERAMRGRINLTAEPIDASITFRDAVPEDYTWSEVLVLLSVSESLTASSVRHLQ